MRKSTEVTVIISALIVCFLIFIGVFLCVKHILPREEFIVYPSKTELKEIVDGYITKEQYREGISYLESLKKSKDKEFLGFISYYLSNLRYNRLNYLLNTSKWQEYHECKSSYLKNILEETETVLKNLPQTRYTLDAQFLRYLTYKAQVSKVEKEEAFDKFKKMLLQYCRTNKEYNIIKEYALRLYNGYQSPEAKELEKIYLSFLQEYLPEGKVKTELKLYANRLLKEKRYYASSFIYDEYIELVIKQESGINILLSLKETMEIYIKAKQFNIAGKYARIAIAKYPQGCLADYFQLKLAMCLFETKEVEKSKEIYYKLLKEHPESKYKETALRQLSDEIKIKNFKDTEKASYEIRGLKKYTTNTETEAHLLANIADIHFLNEQYQQALKFYNDILDKYPDTILILDIKNQIKKCREELKN